MQWKNRVIAVAGLLSGLVGMATPAEARRVTLDDGIFETLGGCSIEFSVREESLCAPISLGFSIEVGDGYIYDSIVVYDDGLVTFGGGVIEGFYDPSVFPDPQSFGVEVIIANWDVGDFAGSGQFVTGPGEVVKEPGLVRIDWYNAFVFWTFTDVDEEGNPCCTGFSTTIKQPPHATLLIQSLPDLDARFVMLWRNGSTDFGYSFTEDVQLASGGPGVFVHVFQLGEPIPEPATWAMMIAGFGMVGSSMRRRRLHAA